MGKTKLKEKEISWLQIVVNCQAMNEVSEKNRTFKNDAVTNCNHLKNIKRWKRKTK